MDLAKYIEHTNLNDNSTAKDIRKLCVEAIKYHFYGVCVYPKSVKLAKTIVKDKCKVITVVGFPLGNNSTSEKVEETQQAIIDGADEIDMVINKEALKAGQNDFVRSDISAVVKAAQGKVVKVIIEAAEFDKSQIYNAVKAVVEAQANIVKTSTGKSKAGGARIEDVKYIKSLLDNFKTNLGIKAAGGISDRESALAMIEAGATRIGASKSVKIIEGE